MNPPQATDSHTGEHSKKSTGHRPRIKTSLCRSRSRVGISQPTLHMSSGHDPSNSSSDGGVQGDISVKMPMEHFLDQHEDPHVRFVFTTTTCDAHTSKYFHIVDPRTGPGTAYTNTHTSMLASQGPGLYTQSSLPATASGNAYYVRQYQDYDIIGQGAQFDRVV
ncbi:uncharacterized protein BCR38DRAFT_439683 [Pseudomassariella vexata]|uniref:Uncharacterized protein n=1 Tax=Pseudomassariella vexata TaxID=1141098 RepID=A0A1Y2DPM9_9PEZI|nr:uncharacterized protein BCR38DRAFT_439683 [Pseudomassariella vexata]ORY61243.1 hypothetical protein BCR38DRAFT_439683 [Pseudomassariella vexata]